MSSPFYDRFAIPSESAAELELATVLLGLEWGEGGLFSCGASAFFDALACHILFSEERPW
jgi:hypothetical protein